MAKRTVTLKGDAKAFIEAKHEELVEAKRAEAVGLDSGKTFSEVTTLGEHTSASGAIIHTKDGGTIVAGLVAPFGLSRNAVEPDEIDEDPMTDHSAEILIESAQHEIERLQAELRSPTPSKDRTLIGATKPGDLDLFSYAMGLNDAASKVQAQWGGSLGGSIVPAIVKSLRDEAVKHSAAVKE